MPKIKNTFAEKGAVLAITGAVASALVAYLASVPIGLGLLGASAALTALAVIFKMMLLNFAEHVVEFGLSLIQAPRMKRIAPHLPQEIVEEVDIVDLDENYSETNEEE